MLQPCSKSWLDLVWISSVGPEEQHPVVNGTYINITALILRREDAQYPAMFLERQSNSVLSRIDILFDMKKHARKFKTQNVCKFHITPPPH